MINTKVLKECKQVLQSEISANHDGLWLKSEFLDGLVERYGLENLLYLCAITIADHDDDHRYSPRNRAWAKGIEFAENNSERYELWLTTHPAILDGVTDLLLKMSKQ